MIARLCVAYALASCSGPGNASAPAPILRVLQVNLCDSGIASCYTGRAVTTAAAVIRARRPEIVTLNEVCREDVSTLARTMSEVHPGAAVAARFEAALDRPTKGPYHCRNGQQYGIGVLAVLGSKSTGYRTFGGRYPLQDLADPEERVWLCIRSPGQFYACTTHTASTSTAIALAQCRYLVQHALRALLRRNGEEPVVLGADLNLLPNGSPRAQDCIDQGFRRVDDGARQDVLMSPGLRVMSRAVVDMHGATDHPGLLVDLARITAPGG